MPKRYLSHINPAPVLASHGLQGGLQVPTPFTVLRVEEDQPVPGCCTGGCLTQNKTMIKSSPKAEILAVLTNLLSRM